MIQDNDRPTYHYLPSEGLLWDPCAAIFWKGRYHLFFLHSSWAESGPPRRPDGYILRKGFRLLKGKGDHDYFHLYDEEGKKTGIYTYFSRGAKARDLNPHLLSSIKHGPGRLF